MTEISSNKLIWLASLVLLFIFFSCGTEMKDFNSKTESLRETQNTWISTSTQDSGLAFHNFKLVYSHAGLGSNMGKLAPSFVLEGTKFKYTLEQNSYLGEQTKNPKDLLDGHISENTIESIIEFVEPLKDSIVYVTNTNAMSGGIDYLHIDFEEVDVTFKLHNASHPIATKIIELLNNYIPDDQFKISLWTD